MASISYAFTMLTQCFPVLAAALAGFALYSQAAWCDASVGKLTKSKCDMIKKVLFGFVGGFIVLAVMISQGIGMGQSGMGMGMGGMI